MPRFLSALLVFLLVTFAIRNLAVLPPTQRAVQRQLERRLSEAAGGTALLGRVRTNLWDRLEIYDLRLHLPDGPVAAIWVDHGQIEFSPWRLLSGHRPLERFAADHLTVYTRPTVRDESGAGPDSAADARSLPLGAIADWMPRETRLAALTVRDTTDGHALGYDAPSAGARSSDASPAPGPGGSAGAEPLLQLAGIVALSERSPAPGQDLEYDLTATGVRLHTAAGAGRPWDAGGHVVLAPEHLELRDLIATSGASRLTASVRVDSAVAGTAGLDVDLPALWRVAFGVARSDSVPIQGSAAARLEIAGPLRDAEVRASLDLQGATFHGVRFVQAHAGLTYGDGILRLDTLRADVGEGWLRGSGRLDTRHHPRPGHLRLALEGADAATLEQLLTGTLGTGTGVVSGSLRLAVDLDRTGSMRVEAELAGKRMNVFDLPLGQWHLEGLYADSTLVATLASDVLRVRANGQVRGLDDHRVSWRVELGDAEGLRRVTGIDVGGRGGLTAHTQGALRRPQVHLEGRVDDPRVGEFRLESLMLAARCDSLGRFSLTLRDGPGAVRLQMSGDLRAGRLDEGRLLATGLVLPQVLRTEDAALWRGEVTADLDFSGSPTSPEVDGVVFISDLGYSDQSFGRAVGSVYLSGQAARARVAVLDSALVITAAMVLSQGAPFTVSGVARRADLSALLALAAAERPGVGGMISGSLEARGRLGDPDSLEIAAHLSAAEVHTPRARMALAQPVNLTVGRGALAMEDILFAGSGGRFSLRGSAVQGGRVTMHLVLENTSLAFLEPFLLDEDMGLDGAVSAGLDVGGTANLPVISGSVAVDDLVLGEATLGHLTGRATYRDRLFRIDELSLDLPRGSIRGEAQLAVPAGSSPRAGASAGPARQPFAARLELLEVYLDSAQALPPGVEVHLSGAAELTGPRLRLRDLTGSLELDHLALFSPRHRVANDRPVRLRLADGHLEADSLRFPVIELAATPPMAPAAAPTPSPGAATGGDTSAEGETEIGEILVAGSTRADPGLQIRATGIDLLEAARLAGWRRPVEGLMDADLEVRGRLSEAQVKASWAVDAGSVDSLTVENMRGSGTYAKGDLALERLEMTLAGGQVRVTGRLPLGAGGGRRPVAFDLSMSNVDLAQVRRLADFGGAGIETLTGRATGSIAVSGTLDDPVPAGRVLVEGGDLAIRNIRPTLALRSAQVAFAGDSVRVTGVRAGDGSWELGALAALDGLRPRWFRVFLGARELDVEVLETMAFTASGDLTWEGTPQHSLVRGQVRIPRGEITEPMSLRTLAYAGRDTLMGAAPDTGWGSRVALDVRLVGRRLVLRNDLVDVPFEGELEWRGTASRPVLGGQIRGLGGTLTYLEHIFTLEQAAIHFNNPLPLPGVHSLFNNPRAVDPEISLTGRTELTARNGNEYEVTMSLGGRISELRFLLVSDPHREQMDVLSLLAFGKEGVPMMDDTGIYLQQRSSLSPSYLLAATEEQFGRVLGLDDVSIDSSVLRPGRLAGSRIVITKQLSDKMEMTYSTAVGYAAQGRVQLQYDLGNNMYVQTEHDAQGESGLDLNLKLKFR